MGRKERRATSRLLAFWEECRGERGFPSLSDLRPEVIGDLWQHCFILDAIDDDWGFCYIGPAYVCVPGGNRRLLFEQARSCLHQVLRTGEPVVSEACVSLYGGDHLLVRSILMPLSDDEESINFVLGAAACRVRDRRDR